MKNCYRNIVIPVLLGILTGQGISSQNVVFESMTSEQGLSYNMVICALQDYRGFMWFGTREGLNRYDGYNFIVYKTVEGDTTSLTDLYVHSLYEDEDSILWVGTINGLCRYNRGTDDFSRYPVSNADIEGVRTTQVGALTGDPDGNIWYGNQFGGIYRFNKEQKKLTYYSSPGKSISSLYADPSGRIWAGTIDSEIYLFDTELNRFRLFFQIRQNPGYIPDNYIWGMSEIADRQMLVAASHGIVRLDMNTGKYKEELLLPEGFTSFRNNEIRHLFEEAPGLYWIGTWGKGLYRYIMDGGLAENYQVEPWNPYSLSNNDVNVVYKDRSGVIWIGTQDGLNILDPARSLFRKYQKNPLDPSSLHFNFITSFCEDRNGLIWIGTYGGGISLFDPEIDKFSVIQHQTDDPNSLINNAIRAICEDPYGNIWIGTMKGLDRYDPEAKRFEHFVHDAEDPGSLSGNDILCVINGAGNDLWIGTYGAGLNRIQLSGPSGNVESITRYYRQNGKRYGLINNYIRSLELDNRRNILIGTLGSGVCSLDPATGNFRQMTAAPDEDGQVPSNNINCIIEDNNGYIWAGTWNGLMRIDPKTEKNIFLNTAQGLPDKAVSEIQQDNSGYLWISTFQGLARMDPSDIENPSIIVYNTDNGLQGNKFNINASMKDSKGKIYFGGTTGFNIIHPDEVTTNPYVPPVVLTNLLIFNEPVGINEKSNGRVILEKSISETREITLTHKHKIVSIEFAGMSYSQREKNLYKYYLEGVDPDWVTVDAKRHFATYSNLRSGKYTFRVKAANSDGLWNEDGVTLQIRVLPAPWQSWWAFVIYGIILLFFLYMGRNYSLTQARLLHKLELEQVEREKAEELNQMKLRFYTNVSHEFRTPLTLILGPLERLMKEKNISVRVLNFLMVMEKNARRLLQLINQLMDFRKIDTGNITLKARKGDIVEFVSDVKKAFDEFASVHKINYELISHIEQQEIWFDRDKLEMILFNLLSNAFKFTSEKGKVNIIISSSENQIQRKRARRQGKLPAKSAGAVISDYQAVIITVEDSGVGIPPDRISKIFDRFYQINESHPLRQTLKDTGTGIGLSITKDYVELHHGEISVESEPGKGTRFTISLRIGDDHLLPEEKIMETEHKDLAGSSIDSLIIQAEIDHELKEELSVIEKERNDEKVSLLIVEDNTDLLNMIAGCFEEEYLVYLAENGADGFEMAVKKVPDLIVSDIMMPGMDGYEFCKKVKKDIRTSHIPVVLLTAYNSLENNIRGFEEGADDYISKPFNISLLESRIKNLIDNRNKLREIFNKEWSVHTKNLPLSTTDEKFMEKAIQTVQVNMSEPDFSVESLGRDLGMSRTNLFRKMKALTGKSASEFIRGIKVKHAATLLVSGYNVSQVMYEVGINSRSYFNKCFYEVYKMTPSEYIKEQTS